MPVTLQSGGKGSWAKRKSFVVLTMMSLLKSFFAAIVEAVVSPLYKVCFV